MSTVDNIRKMSEADIQKELIACRKELLSLRLQASTGELPNVHAKRAVRKKIAVIKTVLTEMVKK